MTLLLYKKKVVTTAVATTNIIFDQNIMVIHTNDEKTCINPDYQSRNYPCARTSLELSHRY